MGLVRTRHLKFFIECIHTKHAQSADISFLLCFYSKMVRTYKRKRPALNKSKMKEAVLSVRQVFTHIHGQVFRLNHRAANRQVRHQRAKHRQAKHQRALKWNEIRTTKIGRTFAAFAAMH